MAWGRWLYGTTFEGGAGNLGTLYRTNPVTGQYQPLGTFPADQTGGDNPYGGVVILQPPDSAVFSLFGTLHNGGGPGCTGGCGTVFSAGR